MSLDFISQMYIPIVLVACLCVGYVIKNFMPTDNKWIPLIMLILGAVFACVYKNTLQFETIVAGAVTGLASTGFHQVFAQLIRNPKAGGEDGTNDADDHEAGDPDDEEGTEVEEAEGAEDIDDTDDVVEQ